MAYIYRPKGKAGEYGELALNHYKGCSHGCKYCYVPAIVFQKPDQFHANPQARALDQRLLDKELSTLRGKSVFLCFTCDPYQPIDSGLKITRQIIQKFQVFGVNPNILTKGGSRSARDFDLLARDPGAAYGATLTFLDESLSLSWEPGAALPTDRIKALQEAHSLGIRTWASLEPVIDPKQSLELIRQTAGFVDEFKIGRWNYDARANEINWITFAKKVVELCDRLGKRYYLKKDLAVFLT
jgi:DNA repair photolyase